MVKTIIRRCQQPRFVPACTAAASICHRRMVTVACTILAGGGERRTPTTQGVILWAIQRLLAPVPTVINVLITVIISVLVVDYIIASLLGVATHRLSECLFRCPNPDMMKVKLCGRHT